MNCPATPAARQWLNAPGTEAHLARLVKLKALATPEQRGEYVERVRAKCGPFWSHYLADDFAAWTRGQKEAA